MLIIVCCLRCYQLFNLYKKIMILKKIGEIVWEQRKKCGYSQEELSFHAGLHRTYIGMIERGEKNITLLNIEKIAKALNVKIKELFDEL